MTHQEASAITLRVGRKKQWKERFWVTAPEGETARIDAVLKAGEARTQFVRDAIAREVRRREAQVRHKTAKDAKEKRK